MESLLFAVRNNYRNRVFVHPMPAIVGRAIAPSRRIHCNKRHLWHEMVLARIFAHNGYRAVLHPHERHEFSIKEPTDQARFVVNARHQNNLKTTVARQWREVSGQELEVDPREFEGRLVEKSDANATHDGRVVYGPLSEDQILPGKVYQRLIDNTLGNEIVDLRPTFVGNTIPVVFRKRRPRGSRFYAVGSDVEIVETSSVFSEEEQSLLLRFAELAGLDFGEADVLRDNESGLIWVVDSTQGAAGPASRLGPVDRLRALGMLAAAFERMLETSATKG